jgi:16S rRNA (uracil1498-N3)-methyltransferase
VHRFYISPETWNPDALVLTGSEVHHARDVLRLNPGMKAVLFNGEGREITAEVVEVGRDQVRLRKLQEIKTPPLRCRITLAQAIPKGKNMDLIVQKAVEIGAAEIFPLISERTIVGLDAKDAAQKQAKWQQVAIEAAKQCGQNWLPQVQLPRKLKDFFSSSVGEAARLSDSPAEAVVSFPPPSSGIRLPGSDLRPLTAELSLIGSLQSDAQHLKKILANYASEHGDRPTNVLMLIGPEGDFTPAELSLAKTHGCLPITLGPIILRVETAAIYCLSVLSYELL